MSKNDARKYRCTVLGSNAPGTTKKDAGGKSVTERAGELQGGKGLRGHGRGTKKVIGSKKQLDYGPLEGAQNRSEGNRRNIPARPGGSLTTIAVGTPYPQESP